MCEIQKNPTEREAIKYMYLVKVHGGTTSDEIIEHVNKKKISQFTPNNLLPTIRSYYTPNLVI